PQVIVDHQHAGLRPPPGDRPSHEAIVQAGGFLMLQDLLHRRLAHVHDGEALPVPWGHVLCVPLAPPPTLLQTPRSPPPPRAPPCAAAALSWCSSSWLSSHRRRWRFGAGSRIHNWMSSLGPMGGGGGQRSTYTPFLCHGLRPELVHNGDEMQ